jgi:hypothetical protein
LPGLIVQEDQRNANKEDNNDENNDDVFNAFGAFFIAGR